MASPYTQPPPVAPPPPYRYRRSLAGPLVLIIIGTVFLLKNMGVQLPVWHFFGRFWPVLLILWGVIKLIEHAMARREGYRSAGIGAGSVVLLIFIIIAGVAAHESQNWNMSGIRDQIQMDDNLGGMFGNAYTFDDTLEQNFPGDGTLRIVCDRGSLNIQPSDGDTLKVVVHKKLYANNQDEANKYNEGSKPQITVNGNTVVLNANTNGAGDHAVSADMDIFVPRKAMLDIASRRGDLTINDRKADVKVSLQRGDANLTEVAGSAKIVMEKGSVRASKISGDVDIEGRIDDATLDDIGGSVQLNGDFFNDIRLSKIAKSVTFKSARSDILLASVPGDLEISGDSLRGTDLGGPSRLVTRSKEIHLEDVRGDLQVETSNGDIEVHTADKLPVGKITLTGKRGDITLVVPASAGFQVDATAKKGDISTDFGGLKVESHDGTARASGTVGNGVGRLQINSDAGDIKINKG